MQRFFVLAVLILLGWLTYRLSPILSPFLVAGILAYLGNPLVTRLQRHRISRTWGTTLVFVLVAVIMAGIIMALLPIIRHQSSLFIEYLQKYVELLQTQIIPQFSARIGIHLDSQSITHYATANAQKLAGWLGRSLQLALSSGSGLISSVLSIILVPVLGFYLLRDWPRLIARMAALIPPHYLPLSQRLASDADTMLMAFLRGQLLVMLALGTSYAIGLSMVGLQTAILVGLVAGLLSFVPYLGVVSGITMASLAMYVQTGAFLPILWVLIVFGIGQVLESMVFTPYLVGDRIGLHPVAVIFAVLAGGELFGFVGLLLALPVTAVLIALLRHLHGWYLQSPYYLGKES
ncbi:AI-2E family transporter [Acidithiobacillus sp.]|jgi:predicted PurR-regulated permease PerM|uniref:AI-2E family transporter n=1 Tax=Acidithiobacillus sp. TaxID=1872118 RepID=UPI0025C07B37|nr:AI-2E family transporter [Acidithiobacillus sp.]MCK9189671.1 AI-2E family transporter [Acidithiobacillus sp.]MCK9359481.1 AI-2E family transporter [Acidithiobacillus sp.]